MPGTGLVPGLDVAGEVEAVAPDVTGFTQGDEVFGFAAGSLAQYAVADAAKLAPKPPDVTFPLAAAIPTAHLTSYQALAEHGKLAKGGKVLIIGASGGCGLSACQLASAMGASEVVGVCSAANVPLATSQGATRCVDYNDKEAMDALLAEGKRYDLVYDAATGSGQGENYVEFCEKVTGGRRVAINGGFGAWLGCFTGLQKETNKLILTRQNGEQLKEIVQLMRKGSREPVVDSIHPLSAEGVDAAYSRLKSRRTRGKIILTMT